MKTKAQSKIHVKTKTSFFMKDIFCLDLPHDHQAHRRVLVHQFPDLIQPPDEPEFHLSPWKPEHDGKSERISVFVFRAGLVSL